MARGVKVRGKKKYLMSNTAGNGVKWNLPSPVACSSPVLAQWQHLHRREVRSGAVDLTPAVTIVESRLQLGVGAGAGTVTGPGVRAGAGTELGLGTGAGVGTGTQVRAGTEPWAGAQTAPRTENAATITTSYSCTAPFTSGVCPKALTVRTGTLTGLGVVTGTGAMTRTEIGTETRLVTETGTGQVMGGGPETVILTGIKPGTGIVTVNRAEANMGIGALGTYGLHKFRNTASQAACPAHHELTLQTTAVMIRMAETNKEPKTPTSITPDYILDHKQANLHIDNHHSCDHQQVKCVPRQVGEQRVSYKVMKRQREASLSLNHSEINKCQDVNISGKCSETFEGHKSNLGDLPLHNMIDNKAAKRLIPSVPIKILDAPGLKDDYYLNLIDWNTTNLIAIALSNAVYVWHPESEAFEVINVESDYVSSVAWIKDRNSLALGTSAGDVQLWDVETKKRIRNMQGHSSMVGSLSWNDYILSSGSKFGSIHHHDVRMAQHHVGTLCGHTSQVCSLKWSPNGRFLASGGNDGLLNIWPNAPGAGVSTVPDRTIDNHQSAVKAINWCPWQAEIMAVGGGMTDGHLRIWDTKTGRCVSDVDTKSQICSLIWLPQYKELVTGHGFPGNEVTVWTYPTLSKSAELKGHTGRVLHLAHSPDGRTMVSLAADETVVFWNCCSVDEQKTKGSGVTTHTIG